MNKIKFSVIVPIYNKEMYLKQCIDSILNQTYRNFELILVDDGSTDTCPFICVDYKKIDDRVVYIHKENGGLVSARKAGTRVAVGDYVICVDSDDYIKEDFLEKIYIEISKHSCDIVCVNHVKLIDDEEVENVFGFDEGYYDRNSILNNIYPSLIQKEDATYFPVNIWGKAFKTDIYKKIQLSVDNSVSIGEDGCVSIPCIYLSNSMSIINDGLYIYRYNELSMTSFTNALVSDYPKRVINEYSKYIDFNERDFIQQVNRFYVHQIFSICRSQFYKGRKYREASIAIKEILSDQVYKLAIDNAHFEGNIKASLMHYLLKRKRIFLIFVVSKLMKV